MFVIAKKELFAFTLNGVTASVRCVSSRILLIVVLNDELARLLAAHAGKKPTRALCFAS